MPLTRVSSVNVSDRVQAREPDATLYKDFRYILDVLEWKNKIVDFPLEITCTHGCEISVSNCEFKKGLIVRIEDDVNIDSVFIFSSNISEGLKVYGSNGRERNRVAKDIAIDSCLIDKLGVVQVVAEKLDIYNSTADEIVLESNNLRKLVSDRSDIGLILECSNEIQSVTISAGSFEKHKIVPKKVYRTLKTRYGKKEYANGASLRTLDLLLRNTNITFPSSETSSLFYERNKIQATSLLEKALLWMFGYFQSPMRYLVTALLWYSFIALVLGVVSIYSGNLFPVTEILRLTLNSFLGLSYTLSESDNYLSSIVLSIAIGMGTIFYSGLLVTMINRFRIRF